MRKFSLLLLILVMALGTTAFAQEGRRGDGPHRGRGPVQFCGSLSEDDCDLYQDFQTALQLPDSTDFELNTDITALVDGAEFEANINATGSYFYDIDVVEAYLESVEDVPLIDASVGDFVDFLESGIDAFDAELFVTVELPPQAGMMLGEREFELSLWLVDSEGYVDLTPASEIAGDPSFAGVFGVDLFDLINIGLEEITLGDVFEALEDADMDEFSDPEFQRQFQQQFENQFQQQLDPEAIAEFATLTRLEDEEIDGMTVAVFQTVVDVAAVFENEEILSLMEDSLPPEARGEIDMDDVANALSDSVNGTTFTITEKYDVDSQFLVESEVIYDVIFDPAPFMALEDGGMMEAESAMGDMEEAVEEGMEGDMDADMEEAVEEAMDEEMATEEAMMDEMATEEAMMDDSMDEMESEIVEFDVVVTFTRSNINTAGPIELPEDAELIPADDFIDLLTGPQTQPVDF